MALLPTSHEWPPFTERLAPPAMPYMVQSRCFEYCPQTPPCQLNHFPQPCVCTVNSTTGTMPNPTP